MLAVSYQLAKFLTKVKIDSIITSIFWLILLILFFGWFRFLYIPEFLGYTGAKATFPFSEESHFALALGMLAIAYSFVGERKWNIFIWLNMFLLSLLYPSLLLLVFTIMLLFVFILKSRSLIFKFALFVLLSFGLVVIAYLINHMEYFSSRLSFEDTKNLTTLVWLQGWQMAYLNFINTNGLGLGFQMLGSTGTSTGIFTELISKLLASHGHLNLEDGGFLAAKVIAEFGFIGVVMILFYLYWIVKIIFILNNYYNKTNQQSVDKQQLLMYGFIFAFLEEMFLRGYGYFSPGVFMFLSAFFTLQILKYQDKEFQHENVN